MNKPEITLESIFEALVYKAARGSFLPALQSFFKTMTVEWGNCDTAMAFWRDKKPTIQLGQKFFATEVRSASDGAEVTLHEICHHLLCHLPHGATLRAKGYNEAIIGIGTDAIINAMLASLGCAGFMEHYYPDEGYYAFLRPNSFQTPKVREGGKRAEFEKFYHDLMQLRVTLEQALEFFHRYFPQPTSRLQLLGNHGDRSARGRGKQSESASRKAGIGMPLPSPAVSGAIGRKPCQGGLFQREEAEEILRTMGIMRVSRETRNNFSRVIEQITRSTRKPGTVRSGKTLSRRPPTRPTRHDLLTIEKGHGLFQRSDYRRRDAWIFLDISGSVTAYLPFVLGLMQALRMSDLTVHAVCWADEAKIVSLDELHKGRLPTDIGGGTNGEAVAQFIHKHRITEAVIVTDNAAGRITTGINCFVHLCLFEKAWMVGSFLDRGAVPRCRVHQLKLRGE